MEIRISESVNLKKLELADATALFDLVDSSRSHLRRWLPWLDDNMTIDDSRKFIMFCNDRINCKKTIQFGIWYKGELAGVIALNEINYSKKIASIGYWLGELFTGHGLITNSCEHLIQYAFDELYINCITIKVAVSNKKSLIIPEKLGFKKEKILEKDEWLYDHYEDSAVFKLTKLGL